jgi:hypothetical protein
MNRTWILMLVVAYPAIVLGQAGSPGTPRPSTPYQPAVPAPSTVNTYGGWGWGGTGGGTVAGNALNGMASVISAKGDYNLSTSAAAVNMTQAQKNEIENRQQWTNTYFEMRDTNRKARAAERGPNPTMEQMARMARQGLPKPLSPSQVDPVSGQIHWPGPLQEDSFQPQRGEVERVFTARARYGSLGYSDQLKVRQATDVMLDGLKAQIQQIPPPDYIASRDFLQSLTYAATRTEIE